jgi:hypothetical protein
MPPAMLRLTGIVLTGLLAIGCATTPAKDPAVVQETLAYVAQIKQWERVEVEVLKAIRDVQRSQFVDDDYVVATLGEVMDDVELHLAEIDAYKPRTPPVAEVHERYRTAWRDLHDSFALIIDTMERKDYVTLAKGTEAMRRSRGELITVAAALNLLLKETGLKEDGADGEAGTDS